MYTKRGPYRGRPDQRRAGEGHGEGGITGLLLANLGTPDAPTTAAVRRYLREFLSDPRVVELPRWLWLPVLHAVVLRVRPPRTAAAYRGIWTERGSPLLANSRAQAEALQQLLDARCRARVRVALGMRYGNPSIESALEELHDADMRRLIVLPLYPQYSATTTGSVFDALGATLSSWRWLPDVRFVSHYHDAPGYLDALAASVREHRARHGRAERLLFSFHGIPQRYFHQGDPYYCECHKTARLVAERLGEPDGEWAMSFQSRVGREPWLEPYTETILPQWAAEGIREIDVLCPGFSADCLETLEEIAIRDAELFQSAGGERLRYIPALNAREDHVAALADIVRAHAGDWLDWTGAP
ncbi:MAG: ferrochelatase [Gammaproteobacteria bacterium]|nr:ferrochelatase [Gammaproteobacteria bacterium]